MVGGIRPEGWSSFATRMRGRRQPRAGVARGVPRSPDSLRDVRLGADEGRPAGGGHQSAAEQRLLQPHDLDHRMPSGGYQMTQYADELVIQRRMSQEAASVLAWVRDWVGPWGLPLPPSRTLCSTSRRRGPTCWTTASRGATARAARRARTGSGRRFGARRGASTARVLSRTSRTYARRRAAGLSTSCTRPMGSSESSRVGPGCARPGSYDGGRA